MSAARVAARARSSGSCRPSRPSGSRATSTDTGFRRAPAGSRRGRETPDSPADVYTVGVRTRSNGSERGARVCRRQQSRRSRGAQAGEVRAPVRVMRVRHRRERSARGVPHVPRDGVGAGGVATLLAPAGFSRARGHEGPSGRLSRSTTPRSERARAPTWAGPGRTRLLPRRRCAAGRSPVREPCRCERGSACRRSGLP